MIPNDVAVQIPPDRLRVILDRPIRLPMTLAQRVCEGCGRVLDRHGDHYAACMLSGRVQSRARPVERMWERVLRESGATVYFQKLLRETTFAD